MHDTSSRIRASSLRQEVFGFASGHSRVPVMATAHRHDDVELVLPLGGTATMQHDGRSYHVEDGTAAVFWAGLPHRLTGTTGSTGSAPEEEVSVAWLTVPLVDVLAGAAGTTAFLAGLLRGQLWCLAAPANLAASMAVWWQESRTGTRLSPAARLEAEGCLVRVAEHARVNDASAGPPAGSSAAAAATTMAAWISEHFRRPLRVDDVAAAVHLHPSTARSVFRRQLGVTIGDYLGQCRTAEAQRLLLSTDATTTEVAHRAGFGSTSRFYARFVHDVGVPPAAYRRRMQG